MSTPLTIDDDDPLQLQRDESDSISAIFSEDFTMYSEIPSISYSINLRSAQLDDDNETENEFWPRDKGLALKVEYPSNYPEELPIFSVIYSQPKARLHKVQERALLNHLNSVAASEKGMPCILSCFYAARDFFDHLGLVLAGLSMLSDDCLACVLSYLASSKEDVDCVVTALPLFQGVYKTDIVWKELCCSRWKEKWGFRRRWEKALRDFHLQQQQQLETNQSKYRNQSRSNSSKRNSSHQPYFWFDRYDFEERDSLRATITIDELCQCPYERRRWFGHSDPLNIRSMRNLLPTGLTSPGNNCQFTFSGNILGYSHNNVTYSLDNSNPNIVIVSSMNAREHLVVHRTSTWGWQMQNDDFVLRSVVEEGGKFASPDQLWKDLTSIIVLQERPPDIQSRIMWREIPEDEDLKYFLSWRARDR
eukprot:CCRYP_014918-RA/>CCRYP_014918-RA protein AED:0.02 eAED:0.02 QI:35/1/1/1/1/1/2/256/419